VHEDHRSQGLGARMLGQVIYAAREAGFDQLHVDVDSGNPGAVQFYMRHGFDVLVESKVKTLTKFSLPASLRLVKSL
jgi:GNAT superfamily N-acetyltransferase